MGASGQRLPRSRASDSYENGVVTIRTEGLTHLHLAVRDLDQSLRFYQGVFGMEELFREGEAKVFLRTPGAADTVTLRRSDSSDRPGDGGGIGHFGFRLADEEDLDRAVEVVARDVAPAELAGRWAHWAEVRSCPSPVHCETTRKAAGRSRSGTGSRRAPPTSHTRPRSLCCSRCSP